MQAVRWSEEVVDNEFMNKKKSKSQLVCHFASRGLQQLADSLSFVLQSVASFTNRRVLVTGVMMTVMMNARTVIRQSATISLMTSKIQHQANTITWKAACGLCTLLLQRNGVNNACSKTGICLHQAMPI